MKEAEVGMVLIHHAYSEGRKREDIWTSKTLQHGVSHLTRLGTSSSDATV